MINKEWAYGTKKGLDRKLKLVGFTFLEDDQPTPKMTVYLREQLISPAGYVVEDVVADYSVVKGKISYDIDGQPLPKNEIQQDGTLQPVLDDDGNPVPRDNAYENIKALVDAGVNPYTLIDAGVREKFKID